jgi:Icc-related predicted phosphoesterase
MGFPTNPYLEISNQPITQRKKLRIAALGDIHVRDTSIGAYTDLFSRISDEAEVLVLCGDLTDHGLENEAEILAAELVSLRVPVVGVLGNHDLEGGVTDKLKAILKQARMTFLDEEDYVINDVGFVGTKGYMGGFEKYALGALSWENATTAFVQEAVNESLKLETALARLHTPFKIVALHYAPIRETIEGESLELYPWLGSSRLVEPIDKFETTAVFHGHADFGKPEGKTMRGIPVFNVAYPLLQRNFPQKPYRIYEV